MAARKRFELLMLPEERHLPRKEEDRVYLEEAVRDFFIAHLAGPTTGGDQEAGR